MTDPKRCRHLLFIAALLFVSSIPFCLGLTGSFVFDDIQNIVNNKSLRIETLFSEEVLYATFSFSAGNGSRPLSMFSFALNSWLTGMTPFGFKSVNLVLHCLTALVVWRFSASLFQIRYTEKQSAFFGFVASSIWACHPIQVSTVLYVVQRMQILSTFFIACALTSYVLFRRSQISGKPSRRFAYSALVSSALGLASKEDAAIIPAITFALEVLFFRFNTGNPDSSSRLRLAYKVLAIAATAYFLCVLVPHYWVWDRYSGRDFNSYERLLTQARVLSVYLLQLLFPAPGLMSFYYDWLEPSRGLVSPPSTALSLVFLGALLSIAVFIRKNSPYAAFGICFFFLGHFITSNIVNLELAFEHRNYLPSIGIALALVDGVTWAGGKLVPYAKTTTLGIGVVLLSLSACTAYRSYMWGNAQRFYDYEVRIAPNSERAWADLCAHLYDESKGSPKSPFLDRAISACTEGNKRFLSPLISYNLIVYKTKNGTVSADDWKPFHAALLESPVTPQLLSTLEALFMNMERDFPMDPSGLTRSLQISSERSLLTLKQSKEAAIYIYNNGDEPNDALPILRRAIQSSGRSSVFAQSVFSDLRRAGRSDWVEILSGESSQ